MYQKKIDWLRHVFTTKTNTIYNFKMITAFFKAIYGYKSFINRNLMSWKCVVLLSSYFFSYCIYCPFYYYFFFKWKSQKNVYIELEAYNIYWKENVCSIWCCSNFVLLKARSYTYYTDAYCIAIYQHLSSLYCVVETMTMMMAIVYCCESIPIMTIIYRLRIYYMCFEHKTKT